MPNLKVTQALHKTLMDLGIDLDTELEIAQDQTPTVTDCLAVLQCAKTLMEAGIPLMPHCEVSDNSLIIPQMWSMEGRRPITFGVVLGFDEKLDLSTSTASVIYPPKKKDEAPEITRYVDVDLTMFAAVPRFLGQLTNYIYRMVFNSDYERDYAHFSMLDLEPLKKDHAILLNGNAYIQLEEGHNSVTHPDTGIVDLIMLQAMVLINQYPAVESLNFTYDPDLRVLTVDTDF